MEIEITNCKLFACQRCGAGSEFKGYYNHTIRDLCPYCACEEVIEILNYEEGK